MWLFRCEISNPKRVQFDSNDCGWSILSNAEKSNKSLTALSSTSVTFLSASQNGPTTVVRDCWEIISKRSFNGHCCSAFSFVFYLSVRVFLLHLNDYTLKGTNLCSKTKKKKRREMWTWIKGKSAFWADRCPLEEKKAICVSKKNIILKSLNNVFWMQNIVNIVFNFIK